MRYEPDDPCFVGDVDDNLLVVIQGPLNGINYVGSIDVVYGKGTMRPYCIVGQFIMIEALDYDIVAFYLLRCLYKIDYPTIMVISYTTRHPGLSPVGALFSKRDMIIVKRIFESTVLPMEYTPATQHNALFRFNLAVVIFFCRFVGVPVSMEDICVNEGVPYLWRPKAMGVKNAKTITPDQFHRLFDIPWDEAGNIYFKNDDGETKPLKPDAHMPGREFEKRSTRESLAYRVVAYFRSIPFDNDVIRTSLYMKENAIRSMHKSRIDHKLSVDIHKIEQIIEYNYAILKTNHPMKIFSNVSR